MIEDSSEYRQAELVTVTRVDLCAGELCIYSAEKVPVFVSSKNPCSPQGVSLSWRVTGRHQCRWLSIIGIGRQY